MLTRGGCVTAGRRKRVGAILVDMRSAPSVLTCVTGVYEFIYNSLRMAICNRDE